jgi:MFS family permease
MLDRGNPAGEGRDDPGPGPVSRSGRTDSPDSAPAIAPSPAEPDQSPEQDRPAGYRDVFGVREFRAVFAADLFSLIGDQIAAVAVAVLLFQDSGSPLLAAAGYATSYVPWLLGGPLLAAWAERFAGRSVMVACDLARAALMAIAVLPGMPSLGVAGLVFLAAMLAPPFDAARSALLTQILAGNRYPVGMSLRQAVHQTAQLCGFALGGALVLALSAPGVLALNCLTFLCSALLLRTYLAHRTAPKTQGEKEERDEEPEDERPTPAQPRRKPPVPGQRPAYDPDATAPAGIRRPEPPADQPRTEPKTSSIWQDMIDGARVVRGDARIWFPLLLGIVGASYAIVPEAIATAYASELGHGSSVVGLIMAAAALGSVVGGLAIGRFAAPSRASRLMYPLALAGTLPLLVVALHPGLVVSLTLFVLCGLGQAFQVVANTEFAASVPANVRTRAFGIAIAGLYGGQSLAILGAGAAAQWLAPSTVIAGSGVVGAVGILLLPHLRPALLRARGRHTNEW